MYVGIICKVVHSNGVSLNAGGMASGGSLLKSLVSKEKRRFKEGRYDLDLTCIPPSSIVSVFMFVCGAFVRNLFGPVDGGSLGCIDFQTTRCLIYKICNP